jgi:hypothetical protein
MKSYKLHACMEGDTLMTKEFYEGQWIENKMTLDVEGPIRFPDDKEGKPDN